MQPVSPRSKLGIKILQILDYSSSELTDTLYKINKIKNEINFIY